MKNLKGSCHCSKVRFEATIPQIQPIECNCSICKRKNALMQAVLKEDFVITQGSDNLSLYQFHTKVAKHYFCKDCGIYVYHQRRSDPTMFGFNLGCVDDEINLVDIEVKKIDGKSFS